MTGNEHIETKLLPDKMPACSKWREQQALEHLVLPSKNTESAVPEFTVHLESDSGCRVKRKQASKQSVASPGF